MAEHILTLDEQDEIDACLVQAKAIAEVTGKVDPGCLVGEDLTNSMWAVSDLIQRVRNVMKGGKS